MAHPLVHPLVDQLRFTRSEFVRGLSVVTDPEAQQHFGRLNCISWIVGHLAWQEQRYWLQRAQGKVLVPKLNELLAYGRPASTPPAEEMWSAWREVTGAADPWLEGLAAEKLLEPLAGVYSNIGTFLHRMIYHYWYHLGEGMAVRQLLGHQNLPDFVGDIDNQTPYRPETGGPQKALIRKAEFLQKVREAYARWDALLAPLEDEAWLDTDGGSQWSLKDIVAHLVWHEREMINVLQARALVGSDLWNLPLDERNAEIYAQNRDLPLQQVRAGAREAREQLLPLIEALSEEDLNDAGRFADFPPEWRPGELLADNTYLHYADHFHDLQNRLEQNSG
jgi:hypothetical protein